MAKLIYSIKICLLQQHINSLPRGSVTTAHQVQKVHDFVVFITHVYSTWWMTCSSAVDAPWNDLQLFRKLLQYEAVNANIAKSAIRANQRHLWYLTAEMVPLALFSCFTPNEEKRLLADRLLAIQPSAPVTTLTYRYGTGFGKPQFLANDNITLSSKLADFVLVDSWFTFYTLKLQPSFLHEEITCWPESAAYQTSLANVQAINVINDCAERGIKLSNDFLKSAKNETVYQNKLQVIENDRRRQPNLRKSN
jgi:hypothetical protein